jgi:hypothetical protein
MEQVEQLEMPPCRTAPKFRVSCLGPEADVMRYCPLNRRANLSRQNAGKEFDDQSLSKSYLSNKLANVYVIWYRLPGVVIGIEKGPTSAPKLAVKRLLNL